MGIPIPVTSSPVKLSSQVAKPYLVTNIGTQTVYLGKSSSVSPTAYDYPLFARNALQWTEINAEIYACTDAGKVSSVVLAPEASAVSLGSVSAQIDQTVQIAGIVQTQQVATATLLSDVTYNLTTGSGAFAALSGDIPGCYKFNSLLVTYECDEATFATPTATNTVAFSGFMGGTLPTCEWYLFGETPDLNSLQFPVTTDIFSYQLNFLQTSLAAGVHVRIKVYGTYAPVAAPIYRQGGGSSRLGSSFPWAPYGATYNALGTFNDWPITSNAMQVVGIRKATAGLAAAVTCFSETRGVTNAIGGAAILAGDPAGTAPQIQVYPKLAPLRIATGVNAAGTVSMWASS